MDADVADRLAAKDSRFRHLGWVAERHDGRRRNITADDLPDGWAVTVGHRGLVAVPPGGVADVLSESGFPVVPAGRRGTRAAFRTVGPLVVGSLVDHTGKAIRSVAVVDVDGSDPSNVTVEAVVRDVGRRRVVVHDGTGDAGSDQLFRLVSHVARDGAVSVDPSRLLALLSPEARIRVDELVDANAATALHPSWRLVRLLPHLRKRPVMRKVVGVVADPDDDVVERYPIHGGLLPAGVEVSVLARNGGDAVGIVGTGIGVPVPWVRTEVDPRPLWSAFEPLLDAVAGCPVGDEVLVIRYDGTLVHPVDVVDSRVAVFAEALRRAARRLFRPGPVGFP